MGDMATHAEEANPFSPHYRSEQTDQLGFKNEELPDELGKLAICSIGRVGIILGKKQLPWGLAYVGTGIDGQEWSSRNPYILSDAQADALLEHYGGWLNE